MSSTFVSLSLETMKDDLVNYIEDEIFDMLEEFPSEEIADCVLAVASHLLLPAKIVEEPLTSCGGLHNYQIKVNNSYKGWVSVSCEETGNTGVSNTMYYPFFADVDGWLIGLFSLAQMINDAWFTCNN